MSTPPVILAITGASGSIYGLRLLEQLLNAQQSVYLLISEAARLVIETENSLKLPQHPADIQNYLSQHYRFTANRLRVFGLEQWDAPVASGSAQCRSMVVCPCSSGTLSAIAQGLSHNLIERAASVVLKERHRLILVHRETPLSLIHLENMLRLTQAGTIIMPASPAFYHLPKTINELVDFIVARILNHLGISHTLVPPWGKDHSLI